MEHDMEHGMDAMDDFHEEMLRKRGDVHNEETMKAGDFQCLPPEHGPEVGMNWGFFSINTWRLDDRERWIERWGFRHETRGIQGI